MAFARRTGRSASALRELGLADAGRAEEQERADRPVRILQAGARRGGSRSLTAATASSWPIDALVQRAPRARAASPARPPSGGVTGMPVHARTTSAISSAPTSRRSSRCVGRLPRRLRCCLLFGLLLPMLALRRARGAVP
jgi:hypothetical protein